MLAAVIQSGLNRMSCGYAAHVEMMDNPLGCPHSRNRLDNASRCPQIHKTYDDVSVWFKSQKQQKEVIPNLATGLKKLV